MRTEQQLRDMALTVSANGSFYGTLAGELLALMIATGMIEMRRGWYYLDGSARPVAHGRRQMIGALNGGGWRTKDLLVEMSKRSVTEQDIRVSVDGARELDARVDAQQQVAWRERVRDAIVGYPSAQALRHAKRRLIDEAHSEAITENAHRALAAHPDTRGMHLGPGHVAPATIEAARAEAADEAARRDGQLVITFDRIGRHGTTSLRFDGNLADDPDEIERLIRGHIRTTRLIASREYDVLVDIEGARVLLDGGRFGRGTIAGLPSRPADELPDCDCQGMTGPDGAHAVACRRGEAIRRRGITTEHDEQAAAYAAAMREYHNRARHGAPDDRYNFERENRVAAAFTRFADLADSGGPGTSRGLRAAVESASTVTEAQLVRAARGMIDKLNTIGLSTPVRVNPHTFASILAGELTSLGFDVSE
jgi:hypothetical protein